MINTSSPFLKKVAIEVSKLQIPLQNICILFPNRRAEIFFKKHLADQLGKPTLSPLLLTAEEFVVEVSGINTLSGNSLLFEAYNQYLKLELKNHDSFDEFLKWANTALYDFNEIDRHMVNAEDLFENMLSAKTIERWGATTDSSFKLIDRFLEIWKTFKPLYYSLSKNGLKNKEGWQGLAYRNVAENLNLLDDFLKRRQVSKIIFAGFNALNKAEETIIEHLLDNSLATIYWDADAYYIDNESQEAGLFIRERIKKWHRYKASITWIGKEMQTSKNITVYGTGGSIEQAKKVGEILLTNESNTTGTAVVLADETLLMPVLNSIPQSYNDINVTMGMSLKLANPGVMILSALKARHKILAKRTLYYLDLQRLLEFAPIAKLYSIKNDGRSPKEFINTLKRQNRVYLRRKDFDELQQELNFDLSGLHFFFEAFDVVEYLNFLAEIVEDYVKGSTLSSVEKEIYFSVLSALRNLLLELENASIQIDYNIAIDLFRSALSSEQISFYGEPLMGLQIMGILETRTLDFETVIITTVNEGVLPSGKSNNSFIPYDIRRYFKMPVHNERDAIYAYHFFRLLQRAKNIHLIYNNTTGGIGGKEKSRFIRQIEAEWNVPGVTFLEQNTSITIKDESLQTFTQLKKSNALKEKIKSYLIGGLSPTSLTEYIKNPLEFYFNRILRVRQEEEIEEVVGHATLGSVVHDVLDDLYANFIGTFPAGEDFKKMRGEVKDLLSEKFLKHYKKGQLYEGKNLLILQVAQTMVKNFLAMDEKHGALVLQSGSRIEILKLEETLTRTLNVPELGFAIKLIGKADRIEKIGNDIFIVDYKTGYIDQKNLEIDALEDVFNPEKEKEKVLQLLMYAYLYKPNIIENTNVYGSVFSLRKWTQGTMVAKIKGDSKKKIDLVFDREMEQQFEDLLLLKICEMHSAEPYFKDINVISLEQPETQT